MQEQDFKKFVEQVRSRNNIVDVISESVSLDRRGYNYWGTCPFHVDKTPSFTVNEDKNMYHCFSCKRSGDIFKFIMETDNVTFIEALQRLAAKVGLEMPDFVMSKRNESNKIQYDRLYQIMTDSARFYHSCLKSDKGKFCRDYIAMRGLMNTTITNFGIGYSPDYDSLPRYLIDKGYTEDEIVMTGVCQRNQKGELYDFEGKRMVIPIMDKSGKVVAFGGRLIEEKTNAGKYLNTKETILFKKKKEIFGYNNLKKAKQEGRLNQLILVEGYMDVISLAQAGFANCCASMGTAFGIDHCKILEFYSKNIYLCYDGDEAGQTAIESAINILKGYNLAIKVVMLPGGLDPDDYIKQYGADSYQTLVNSAVSPTEFLMMRLLKAHDLSDPVAKGKCLQSATKLLRELPTQVEREIYLPFAARIFNISESSLIKDLDDNASSVSSVPSMDNDYFFDEQQEPQFKKVDPKYEKYIYSARHVLFALLKKHIVLASKDEDLAIFFVDNDHKTIFDIIRYNSDNNELSLDLLNGLESKESKFIKDIIEYKAVRGESTSRFYEDCLNNLKEQYYDMMFADINNEFKAETDPDRKKELMTLLGQIASAKREIKGR